MALSDIVISHAFIGSCTNARIEDLRDAASVVRGKHVAEHVRAMIVPGSSEVRAQAEAEGLAADLYRRRFRMAPVRLLDVPGDERRRAGPRRPLRVQHQP